MFLLRHFFVLECFFTEVVFERKIFLKQKKDGEKNLTLEQVGNFVGVGKKVPSGNGKLE